MCSTLRYFQSPLTSAGVVVDTVWNISLLFRSRHFIYIQKSQSHWFCRLATVTEAIMVNFGLFLSGPSWRLISVLGPGLLQNGSLQVYTQGIRRVDVFCIQTTSLYYLNSRPGKISEPVLWSFQILGCVRRFQLLSLSAVFLHQSLKDLISVLP